MRYLIAALLALPSVAMAADDALSVNWAPWCDGEAEVHPQLRAVGRVDQEPSSQVVCVA